MVHTAQRGKVYGVIICVALFILFASGFITVWVVVNKGMKVDFVKAEEYISVGKHDSISEKAIKNNLEDIQCIFGNCEGM